MLPIQNMTIGVPYPPTIQSPLDQTIQVGQTWPIFPKPLTEEDLRRIIREELSKK